MTDTVTAGLLSKLAQQHAAIACEGAALASSGDLEGAIALLTRHFDPQQPDKAVGSLLVHWLHQNRAFAQANAVVDAMIGLDLSRQLSMDNCPDEAEIMARWTRPQDQAISVVCVTFNHERFIDMALASFFSQQTTHPFEVLVRDDASTDATVEIVRRWQQRYPRILRLEALDKNTYSQGIPAGRSAMALARHPLVAICEGDDFWVESDKLERQARYLVDNPTWSAVTHNHFELNESTGQLTVGRPLRSRGFLSKEDLLQVHLVLWVHTLMLRKSLLDLPPFNTQEGILGDQVLTAMLGAGGPVYYLGDCVASVARRNLASTYTPLSASGKQLKRIRTKRFIAQELERLGQQAAAHRLRAWCERAQATLKSAEPVGA